MFTMVNFKCILLKLTHTHTHSLVSAAHSKGVPKFLELAEECALGQNGGANGPGLVSKAGRATTGSSLP